MTILASLALIYFSGFVTHHIQSEWRVTFFVVLVLATLMTGSFTAYIITFFCILMYYKMKPSMKKQEGDINYEDK